MVGEPEPEQLFIINSKKDTFLIGSKGTQMLFKANSFFDSLGQSINGSVRINLKEYYTVQDFINNRLSTQTVDGKLLRSSGMISLKLSSDNGSVRDAPGKPYMIKFKGLSESQIPDLFRGKTKMGNVEWELIDSTRLDPIIQFTEKIEAAGFGVEKVSWFIDTLGFISPTTGDSVNFTRWPRDWDQAVDSLTIYEDFLQRGYYLFETSTIGLINCDFFIDEELFYFTVELDNSVSDVFVVLDSLNSVMYPDSINTKANQYLFKIPEGKPITILAFNQDGGKYLFAIQKINTDLKRASLKQAEWALVKIKEEISNLK